VAAHDKAGWLALFCREAVIEDPVGTAPHRRGDSAKAIDPLERFYETFIAQNQIRFESSLDVVAGYQMARDVVIHTQLASGINIEVAAYLLYKTVQEQGELRISHMAAHWDLPRMSWQVTSNGLRGLTTMTAMTGRMLRFQGVSGIVGYMRGMVQGIGARGRAEVDKFASLVQKRDARALAALWQEHETLVEWPAGETISAPDLLSRFPAGVGFAIERPISSGWVTAFRFTIAGEKGLPGIAFFQFDPVTHRIARARFFPAA
jgi:hypothetical protein